MCGFSKAIGVTLEGSGKAEQEWRNLAKAQVYHDHFIAAEIEDGVVIDFLKEDGMPPVQICLELSATSARELAEAILATVNGIESNARPRLR
ncbi:MAG: hypothetical protein EXR50_03740 [Dehalococcoidia bacterium]|nr:hypothetical protein [Dehalococcoidia bacterium]